MISKSKTLYGIIALFDVLMQSFYRIMHVHNEKISSYTTRIEGAFNEIRLKYPDRLDREAMEGNLREQLFHDMKKGIRDSLYYLFDNPSVIYTQLVVTTQKNERKLSVAEELRSNTAEVETGKVIVCWLP